MPRSWEEAPEEARRSGSLLAGGVASIFGGVLGLDNAELQESQLRLTTL